MSESLKEMDDLTKRIFEATLGADPVHVLVALAKVMTGYIAALAPDRDAASEGCRALVTDMERNLDSKWPGVELLRQPPQGRA